MSEETALVRILRQYPRRGTTYGPGELLEVPESALPGILEANPPFGELVEETGAHEEVPAPDEVAELADEYGLDLDEIEGTGENGRVLVSDVEREIQEQEE